MRAQPPVSEERPSSHAGAAARVHNRMTCLCRLCLLVSFCSRVSLGLLCRLVTAAGTTRGRCRSSRRRAAAAATAAAAAAARTLTASTTHADNKASGQRFNEGKTTVEARWVKQSDRETLHRSLQTPSLVDRRRHVTRVHVPFRRGLFEGLSPGQGLRTRAKRTTGKQGLRYTPRPEAPHYYPVDIFWGDGRDDEWNKPISLAWYAHSHGTQV